MDCPADGLCVLLALLAADVGGMPCRRLIVMLALLAADVRCMPCWRLTSAACPAGGLTF